MNAKQAAAARVARFVAYTTAVVTLARRQNVTINALLVSDSAWQAMAETGVPLEEALARVTVERG